MQTIKTKKAELEALLNGLERYRPVVLPSVMERCVELARGFRLYQEIYPETKRGGDRTNRPDQEARSKPPVDFVSYCEGVMLKSNSAVRLDIKIGNGLTQTSCILLRHHPTANNATELQRLSELKGTEQLAVAYLIAKEGVAGVKEALAMANGVAIDSETPFETGAA